MYTGSIPVPASTIFCIYYRIETPQNFAEAFKWYRRASEQGYAKAQFNLGVMYANENGVVQDNVIVQMWYNITCVNEIEKANDQRYKRADLIRLLETSRAKAMATECINSPTRPVGIDKFRFHRIIAIPKHYLSLPCNLYKHNSVLNFLIQK